MAKTKVGVIIDEGFDIAELDENVMTLCCRRSRSITFKMCSNSNLWGCSVL